MSGVAVVIWSVVDETVEVANFQQSSELRLPVVKREYGDSFTDLMHLVSAFTGGGCR